MAEIKRGSTGIVVPIIIQDATSTTGGVLTGVTYSSVTAYYLRDGDSSETLITLVSGTKGTWISGGLVEVSASHMPGHYLVSLPNDAFAGSGLWVTFSFQCSGAVIKPIKMDIVAIDAQDATAFGVSRIDENISASKHVAGYDSGQDPATLLASAGYTSTLATNIGTTNSTVATNLNATVSSRQSSSSAVTLPSTVLQTGDHTAIQTDVTSGLTTQGYTITRAEYVDALNGLVSSIWSNASRTLSAFGFSVSASNLPSDYQQRGVAITLPSTVLQSGDHTAIRTDISDTNVTIAGYAAGQDPATILKADSRFSKLLSYVDGNFAYDPITHIVSFYAPNSETVLFTATLTLDSNENITARTIS